MALDATGSPRTASAERLHSAAVTPSGWLQARGVRQRCSASGSDRDDAVEGVLALTLERFPDDRELLSSALDELVRRCERRPDREALGGLVRRTAGSWRGLIRLTSADGHHSRLEAGVRALASDRPVDFVGAFVEWWTAGCGNRFLGLPELVAAGLDALQDAAARSRLRALRRSRSPLGPSARYLEIHS